MPPRWPCSVCLQRPCECWKPKKPKNGFQLTEGWCFVCHKSKVSCDCE